MRCTLWSKLKGPKIGPGMFMSDFIIPEAEPSSRILRYTSLTDGMPTLQQARLYNASRLAGLATTTAVVFGATSGIGEEVVKLLAMNTQGNVNIVLVGRNKDAAERIMASLPPYGEVGAHEGPDETRREEDRRGYQFIYCDITLMSNIRTFTSQLEARGVTKVNSLVLSAGVFGLGGREETVDGLDVKLVARFYSRFAIIQCLLPMLREAAARGEDASILSILGAGQFTGKVDFTNLGLKSHYAGWKAMLESCGYGDLMVQGFAERNPNIAFTHIYPGSVDTGMYHFRNPFLNFIVRGLGRPVLRLCTTRPEDCAQWMVYALLEGAQAVRRLPNMGEECGTPNMFRRDPHAADIGMSAFTEASEEEKVVFWDHCTSSCKSAWAGTLYPVAAGFGTGGFIE